MSDGKPEVEMAQERAERLKEVNKTTQKDTPPEGSIRYILQDIDLKDVAIAALIATAGIGGYILGRWPNTQPIPDIAQAYAWFGLAIGVAITSAFIVSHNEKPEENE